MIGSRLMLYICGAAELDSKTCAVFLVSARPSSSSVLTGEPRGHCIRQSLASGYPLGRCSRDAHGTPLFSTITYRVIPRFGGSDGPDLRLSRRHGCRNYGITELENGFIFGPWALSEVKIGLLPDPEERH